MTPGARYYPAEALFLDETDVIIVVNDREFIGKMRLTNTGKRRFFVKVDHRNYEAVPSKALIALWRPIDEAAWPDDLPEAVALTREQPKRPHVISEEAPEPDIADATDIVLRGPGERPASLDEVEHKLIRCLRTRAALEKDHIRRDVAWPRPWRDEAMIIEKELASSISGEMRGWQRSDYDDFFVDRSALHAKPARFQPTARDVSNIDAGEDRKWLSYLPTHEHWLFRARAKMPALDWWQIADGESVDEALIRERYKNCLRTIYRRVTTESKSD